MAKDHARGRFYAKTKVSAFANFEVRRPFDKGVCHCSDVFYLLHCV